MEAAILGAMQYVYDFIALIMYAIYALGNVLHIILQPFLYVFEVMRNALPTPLDLTNATSSISYSTFSTNSITAVGSAVGITVTVMWGIVFALMVLIMLFAFLEQLKHV